jgi:hypothetical protein
MIRKFLIEGIDRLGKNTLIDGIMNELGYFEVIHFARPRVLDLYSRTAGGSTALAYAQYQTASFENMFKLIKSNARIIFNRAHLGEVVYSPMYRGYDGEYVFEQEKMISDVMDTRLILLTEDFSKSKHFIDDGLSFDVSKRCAEQELFLRAFDMSLIQDKRVICVTAEDGNFRPAADILHEALK